MTRITARKDIAALKAQALARVDAQAEVSRGRIMRSFGGGRAVEHFSLIKEVERYEAGDRGRFPLLQALRHAYGDAGRAMNLDQVVAEVRSREADMITRMARIVHRHQTAVLRIEAASTPTQIEAAATVAWSE